MERGRGGEIASDLQGPGEGAWQVLMLAPNLLTSLTAASLTHETVSSTEECTNNK